MSKIIKLKIKNMFGITAFEWDGKDLELKGVNGTGKTSVINAIKFALKNKSNCEFIIKNGESESEVFIETDAALSINRKVRLGKTDYKSVKEAGKEVEGPEALLRELFTDLQLNPVEFLAMDAKAQNRMILNMIEFKWGMDWIKEQFGEIVPDVNYEQNILDVLFEIQSDEGYYYLTRQDINRDTRNKIAMIEEIGATLPKGYDAAKWELVSIGELYKKIEVIRSENKTIEKAKTIIANQEGKIRQFEADRDIELAAIDRETAGRRNSIKLEIQNLQGQIQALETESKTLEEKKLLRVDSVNQTFKANVSEYETLSEQNKEASTKPLTDLSGMLQEAEQTERMKAFINEYKRMAGFYTDVENLKAQSEALTVKIEHARNLPGEILKVAKLPIAGLSVQDGRALINGLPISNLSEGEKLNLCLDIAARSQKNLNLVLIDGVEKLSTDNRNTLYAKCKEKGIQFVVSRTTDDKFLTAVEI